MWRRGKLTIVGVAAALALAGCFEDSATGQGSGTSSLGNGGAAHVAPSAQPQIGDLSYDKNNCELKYTGTGVYRGWDYHTIDGEVYCYKKVGMTVFDGYPLSVLKANGFNFSALKPTFQRDFNVPTGDKAHYTFLLIKPYSDGLWRRSTGPGIVEVQYQGKWWTLNDYNAQKQRELATANAHEQQRAASARARTNAQVSALYEQMARVQAIPFQPACNWDPPCR